MTDPELSRLETLTRDYAAFQARKSGLVTTLGGLLVCLMFWVVLMPTVFGVKVMQRPALEVFLLLPFLWLVLKAGLARLLYRGLGTVKPQPDPGYERRLSRWTFGLALFLMAFLIVAIYGFVSGVLLSANPVVGKLPVDHPLFHPWAWLIWLPLAYLIPVPWAIRGVEEARAYAVLVGQCMLWLTPVFLFSFVAPGCPEVPFAVNVALATATVALPIGLLAWAALALIRGWKEHREYLEMLRALPGTES